MLKSILLVFVLLGALPAAMADPVDINTADAATLAASLKGVGPAKARAIVAFREQNGPFRSIDELTEVRGIGEKLLEQNRDRISVGEPEGK
ncbi:MAG: helix-hairpin-helix domain-containing protein [Gammaproteobacteria bacterium]|nr:MAG: helix-hairpin-helix domain-containing protein [Gammaproteobacteria bacterium]